MVITRTTTTCSRHPKVETNLRCASCGTPICPKCLVQTPVGAKCRQCATNKGVSLSRLSPVQSAGAAGVGLVMGAVAGWGVSLLGLGFFLLFLAFPYGTFAGEMILRASGRRRSSVLELIAGVTMAAGAIGGRMLIASGVHMQPPLGPLDTVLMLVLPTPFPAIAIAIAVAAAVSRIRYL